MLMALPVIAAAVPVVSNIIKGIIDIIDQLVPDKDAAAKLKHEATLKILENEQDLLRGQIDINKAEALTDGVFKGGWRPFIGWVCGVALAWNFIGYDLAVWAINIAKTLDPAFSKFTPPVLTGSQYLIEIVMAMLGLAGWRSLDKIKGVNK
jgi:hypothetical protein